MLAKRCTVASVSLVVLILPTPAKAPDCGNGLMLNRYGRREWVHRAFVAAGTEGTKRYIRKFERARNPADAALLLKYIAYTKSDLAFEYLRRSIDDRSRTPTRTAFLAAINAMAYTEDPRAVDVGLRLLRTEDDGEVRAAAARVVGKTLDFTEVDRPDALDVLHGMEWDRHEYGRARRQAWYGMTKLQRYGLAPEWPHPPELGARRPLPQGLLEQSRRSMEAWKTTHPAQRDVECPKQFIHCGIRE